jgi:CHAD domain-containing protein
MVTRERLHKFISKQCHEIRHQVRVFCTTRDGEALHHLRVEVKKLRAALVLIRSGAPAHHLHTKGIKELYTAAGAIRTAQINLKILQQLGVDNKAFATEQQRIIEEGSLAFCLAANQYRQDVHSAQEHLEAGAADIKPQKVKELFDNRIRKLSLFFSAASLDTVALHDTRKETKDLLYIHTLLPPALAASLHINKEYLDKLQHSLGSWHDNTVVLSLLQDFGNTDPPLLKKLHRADDDLLKEIIELTIGFDAKIHTPADKTPPPDDGQSDSLPAQTEQ